MQFKVVLNSAEKGALQLPYEPNGWKDMEAVLKRSLEYHGIFYEFMVQFEFKCGSGKEYIDSGYDQYGVDWVCSIQILASCQAGAGSVESPDYTIDYSDDYGSLKSGSGIPIYETFFEGTLKLDNYSKTSESTFCDLIQSDFVQKVLNRFQTKVNIDSNVTLDNGTLSPIIGNPYTLNLPSKVILLESKFTNFSDADSLPTPYNLDVMVIEMPLFVDIDEIGGCLANASPYIYTVFRSGTDRGIQNVEPIYSNDTALPVTFTLEYNFVGNLSVRNSLNSTVDFSIYFQLYGTQFSFAGYPSQPNTFEENVQMNIPFVAGNTKVISINATGARSVTIAPGDKMFIGLRLADIVGSSASPGLFELLGLDLANFKLKFTQQSITPDSTSQAYLIHETGAAIAQRITNQEDAFRSELLGRKDSQPTSYLNNGCFSFAAITNGKKIREFPNNNNLYISMADYFKTVNSINNVGLSIEKSGGNYLIRIEGKEYFYSTNVILQLPNCPKIKTAIAKEYYISDVLIGYDKWESEETNGIDEFNTKHEYNDGIKAIESRIELFSPIIASSYAIEFTRRKSYALFPTTDWKYDSDNFIVCLNRSIDGDGRPNNLGSIEKNENYSQINNIISPTTTYNYRISPARNLLRHVKSIAGSILKYPSRPIKFTYGEGNYLASTQFGADSCPGNFQLNLLAENQDITVEASGDSPIWIPEYLDFQYPLTFAQYLLIKNNPFKCIEVSDSESNFIKGFIVELHYKPVGGLTSFKLLKAYGN